MIKQSPDSFIGPTMKFCVAGLFIPGFTVFPLLAIQKGLQLLGVACSGCWTILWAFTAVGAVALPMMFTWLVHGWLWGKYNLTKGKLLLFNILEYTFLQCALAMFFTSGETLCYVTNGQNGLEFVFTAWMALPVLVGLSSIFDEMRKRSMSD